MQQVFSGRRSSIDRCLDIQGIFCILCHLCAVLCSLQGYRSFDAAVRAWYSEESGYSYNGGSGAGHFTQMVSAGLCRDGPRDLGTLNLAYVTKHSATVADGSPISLTALHNFHAWSLQIGH